MIQTCIDCGCNKDLKRERKIIYALKRRVAKLLPDQRVAGCQKHVVPSRGNKQESSVYIRKHKKTQSAFFANLQRCGSVWPCPSCAVKITEARKAEMMKVKEKCKELGLIPYMLTLTFRHNKREKLKALLGGFFEALDGNFFNNAFWRKYKKTIGLLHFVKVLEVMHSDENGWHVHIHMLLICEPFDKKTGECFEDPSAEKMLLPWQLACKSAGLGVPDFHGVTVTSHNAINQYVAKWGLESELTKQHVKKGREGHHSPFDLLRLCEFEKNVRAGELFKEYYWCFKGRRQMVRSRGFNQFFQLGKFKTDIEIANEAVEESDFIGTINCFQWKSIKFHEAQEIVLEAAEISGMQGVWDVLEILDNISGSFNEGMEKERGS
jgi:hypothetical protein